MKYEILPPRDVRSLNLCRHAAQAQEFILISGTTKLNPLAPRKNAPDTFLFISSLSLAYDLFSRVRSATRNSPV